MIYLKTKWLGIAPMPPAAQLASSVLSLHVEKATSKEIEFTQKTRKKNENTALRELRLGNNQLTHLAKKTKSSFRSSS